MHRHHIVPRHMGGTDDESNLTPPITVEDHAIAHWVLYRRFGKQEDWLAWKGLTGEITHAEAVHAGRALGGKRAGGTKNWTEDSYRRATAQALKNQAKATEASKSPQSRQKRLDSFAKIGHQKGAKNSQYGKRWIHSLSEKRSTTIDKSDPLPKGWLEGRKMKFC